MNNETKTLKREELGIVGFGTHAGKKWSKMPVEWLKWVISDNCLTGDKNKEIARKELQQRSFMDGQMEML